MDCVPAYRNIREAGSRKFAKRILCLVAVAACVSLTACATPRLSPEKAAQYKRVGLLTTTGDDFDLMVLGVTIFGTKENSTKLDIGADEIFTREIKKALSKKYTVVDLSRYRKPFMDQPKFWPGDRGRLLNEHPMAPDVVRRIMGDEKLDAYIFVIPDEALIERTDLFVSGIGVLRMRGLVRDSQYLFHAAYSIAVIDGKNFALVGRVDAAQLEKRKLFDFSFKGGRAVYAPTLSVPAHYHESPSKFSKEIRDAFQSLMDRSIPDTLRRSNLLQ